MFELPPSSDVTMLKQGEAPQWDSLAHVTLVTAVESEFGVSLETVEQLQMTSYESTLQLLTTRAT
ncbi:MAG TPA: acyl carrier protein [Gemmatimonadaceae bacterium]|nr:acyl carrier protein [Gemmatimonadaceae bacterium]